MDKEQLRLYLSEQYKDYKSFLENIIFPIFGEEDFEDAYGAELLKLEPERRPLAEATGIKSIKSIGSILVGIEPLQIFDITVSDRVRMERNRVNIQRLIRNVMDIYSSSFMIFHYDDDVHWDWRFTYCHKGKNSEEYTDSKRYTFLLGPEQSCRTATDNFMSLYEKRGNIDFKDIEQAFSVEALSKEFFGKYKYFYEKFVKYMTTDETIRTTFLDKNFDHTNMSKEQICDREEKPMRDYAKKLLGRIVFLHFLQKKGWLGVKAGEEWGTGPRDFMLKLFKNATNEQRADFLDGILEPLYDKGLDTKRADDLFDTRVKGYTNVRIPYLNGGLFERDTLDKKICKLPAEYFEELLDTLSWYNFTIDENDPNDAEVGVDPEMLGRIFENLLEDNKDKGAYYTPKEIVQYMCRESLIAYLQTDLKEEDKEKVRKFVMEHDAEPLGELREEIVDKLIEVKICDPAIGSGAFPMGLLRELFYCRSAINAKDAENAAKTKREIIQNNIYGVDIDRGAVDIAQLRFWLALVVDEKEPSPLPNLDFKIMQGNSLLESYKGFDFSKLTTKKMALYLLKNLQTTFYDDELDFLSLSLSDKIKDYYSCDDHDKRLEKRKEIAELVKKQLEAQSCQISLDDVDIYANDKFFLWHTWFTDVFSRPTQEGFDIVIGNPPYGASYSDEEKKVYKKQYQTAKTITDEQKGSLDTYTLFVERGFNLLKKNGCFAYIVPISITSSDSLTGVHRLLMNNCETIRISSYAVRPQPVFENAVVDVSILLFRKTDSPCQYLYSTKMYRKGNQFNLQRLVDNLAFVEVKDLTLYGRIPKIGTDIEKSLLKNLKKHKRLGSLIKTSGCPIYYRFAGGRYFKVITNYSNGSSAERKLCFATKKLANAIGCMLSSSLSFWFYQIYSDNHNWKSYEIENFPIPPLSDDDLNYLDKLYTRYLTDIEEKANIRTSSGNSTYRVRTFKEYKIVRSKAIIDEIDDYICPLYGLTQEETDFIKNYELEFRLAGE